MDIPIATLVENHSPTLTTMEYDEIKCNNIYYLCIYEYDYLHYNPTDRINKCTNIILFHNFDYESEVLNIPCKIKYKDKIYDVCETSDRYMRNKFSDKKNCDLIKQVNLINYTGKYFDHVDDCMFFDISYTLKDFKNLSTITIKNKTLKKINDKWKII